MLGLVGGLLSSVAGGVLNMFGQQSANQQNQAYQTEMSNTAYQRASADMTKAGLNPMMMFGSGGPASTPPGTQQNAMSGLGDALKGSVKSATDAMISQKTMDYMTDQMAKMKAEQANVEANTKATQLGYPSIAAKASLESRAAKAIGDIPDVAYVPTVQAGFGADATKNLGPWTLPAAAASSAKSLGGTASQAMARIAPGLSTAVNSISDGVNAIGAKIQAPHFSGVDNATAKQAQAKLQKAGQMIWDWLGDTYAESHGSGRSTVYKNGPSPSFH